MPTLRELSGLLRPSSVFVGIVWIACARPHQATQAPTTISDTVRQARAAAYRGGRVTAGGDADSCYFTAQGDTTPRRFGCGQVILGFRAGLSRSEVDAVVRQLSGRIIRDRTDRADPWVLIAVRHGTESDVVAQAYLDARVDYAQLNWNGIVIRSP